MTSTREACLADMRASFADVMAVLATIPRERLTEVGVTEEWSVRDTGSVRRSSGTPIRSSSDFAKPASHRK
jgi:hypothetical protein